MIEFDTTLPREKLMVQIFKFVQEIPFKFTDYEEFDATKHARKETVTTNIECGDSRHKSTLLYNLLMQQNFEAEKYKVIFDWKDMPIPKDILEILEKSTTRQAHDILNVRLRDNCKSFVDPTWDPKLKDLGFPVTEVWDGKENTKQVSPGKIEFYPSKDFNPEWHGIITDPDEYEVFKEAMNEWLEESRGMPPQNNSKII